MRERVAARLGRPLLAVALSAILAPPAVGQVTIRVVPDRVVGDSTTVGDPLWVTVVARGPSGHALLPESVVDAYAPHEELAVLDHGRRDGQLRLRIALFRPGRVVLPTVSARVVAASGDTVAVPVVSDTIPVASVLAPGDTLLADIKPPWRPETSWAWLWWVLALALLAALVAVAWRRRRRKEVGREAAPPRDPYEVARSRIRAASGARGDAASRIRAAAEIGEALRDYLVDGWGVAARERTTLELLADLPPEPRAERAGLGSVLAVVDLAKFARVAPSPEGIAALARRALDVLERLEGRRGDLARTEREAGEAVGPEGEAGEPIGPVREAAS